MATCLKNLTSTMHLHTDIPWKTSSMMNLKNPSSGGQDNAEYRDFINKVAMKVHNLDDEYSKLTEKLTTKQEDIWKPIIKIGIGMNQINTLCDLGISVSTIPKSLYDKLNLGPYVVCELRLTLAGSTFKQAAGIKQNIVVQIKDCPILLDHVIVDMPKHDNAPIILGRPFLRMVKALTDMQEGNIKFNVSSRQFLVHFPWKNTKFYSFEGITLKVRHYGHFGIFFPWDPRTSKHHEISHAHCAPEPHGLNSKSIRPRPCFSSMVS